LLTLWHSRFGEYLQSSMIREFRPFYIAYDQLKKALRTDFATAPTPETPKPARKEWTEDDEKNFVALLESELEKVFTFQKQKSEEIVERIKLSEAEVLDVVGRLEDAAQTRRGSIRPSRPPPTDEDFLELEQILSDIIADVHDLAKFTQLNYTGFQKIIKKHDVRPSSPVTCRILTNYTERNPMVP
jgi:SPX domain protein involved in polyphosphate accumulation